MRPKITLDAAEESIRSLLLAFSSEFVKKTGTPVTLRVTGGWVRDKLLNRPSHDIDIAIDRATGEQFANALREYLIANGRESETGSVHTIASNPAKSKHLETATTRLYGLDVDFVNLRSEEYTSESRIPIMKFGTPQQDALRRDATLNALFYNLQDDCIEDFTERGLQDLQDGILRTPMDAFDTFRDDPLRVLRLIRFAAQLDFHLAAETATAMVNPEISKALEAKVSRERVGKELEKLVEAPHALKGLRYAVTLGLAPHIFTIPPDFTCAIHANWATLNDQVEQAAQLWPHLSQELSPKTPEEVGTLWLAVVLQGWRGLVVENKKKRPESAVTVIIRDGVKLPAKRAQLVSKMIENGTSLPGLNGPRHVLSRFVRQRGEQWRLYLAFIAFAKGSADDVNAFAAAIVDQGVADAYSFKPVVDGRRVKALFPGRPSGQWIQESVENGMDFQVDHPEALPADIEAHVIHTTP